ncbi:LacI family DNA-binding transcriptional regulator [Poriferisphaera sp. WC338]|uniref:LacI family DNA-binding transcriptional regulator n=1 Tax=Poriferisphaera sp. WC338 TaxID=3425129 RepID=UPI003D8125DA
MKDIAERANVSLTTVSRILRSQRLDSFPEDTRNRVLKAAEELGWLRNRLVQGIQTGRTGTIGILAVPFDSFWGDVIHGLHDELLATNRVPLLLWPDYEKCSEKIDLSERAQLQRFMEHRVEGIATWPLADPAAKQYIKEHVSKQVALVTIDYTIPNSKTTTIMVSEKQAAKLIIDHLVKLGHRRIAYVDPPVQHAWASKRAHEVSSYVKKLGLSEYFSHITTPEEDETYTRSVTKLLEGKSKPTAIVGATDHYAIRICQIALQQGLSIPRDLSITGYGNLTFEGIKEIELTTINQHPRAIGIETAKQLLYQCEEKSAKRKKLVEIAPTLIVRESTACVASL